MPSAADTIFALEEESMLRSILIVVIGPVALAGQQVYRIGDPGVIAPVAVSQARAHYTMSARERGVEGNVRMEAVVGEDGTVTDVRVSLPLDDDLDGQAVEAVKRWTFRPGTKAGQPVPVEVTLVIRFTLR
jgi:TonB family protein